MSEPFSKGPSFTCTSRHFSSLLCFCRSTSAISYLELLPRMTIPITHFEVSCHHLSVSIEQIR